MLLKRVESLRNIECGIEERGRCNVAQKVQEAEMSVDGWSVSVPLRATSRRRRSQKDFSTVLAVPLLPLMMVIHVCLVVSQR